MISLSRAFFCLVLLACASNVAADDLGNQAEPIPRGAWMLETRDASLLWGRQYSIDFRSDYYPRDIPVPGFPVTDAEVVLRGELLLSYGLLQGRIDLSGGLRFYGQWLNYQSSSGRETPAGDFTGDIGDSWLSLRMAVPSPASELALNLETFVTLPTGPAASDSTTALFTTNKTDAGILFSGSWRGARSRFHLQTGYRLNQNESSGALLYPIYYPPVAEGGSNSDNDAWLLRAGAEFHSAPVDIIMEIIADRIIGTDGLGWRETPVQLIPGIRYAVSRGFSVSAHWGISLSQSDADRTPLPGFGATPEELFPDWSVSMRLRWTKTVGASDRDRDGIADPFDRCPIDPEDYDGYQDDDGCPDLDNDRDGIPDLWDKAPSEAEDMDGFQDDDGAPDYDNDGDGIPDIEDYCPDAPEDFDGDRDDDGCPDVS